MPDKHIHVVAFNIPYPPNYGGVIDIYYKLKAFDEIGVKVHLHCYEYNRNPSKKLLDICETVRYYKRNLSKANLFSTKPYIVSSRNSDELINNLLKDKHPILFEGLHTCFFIDDKRLKNRIKIVRTHNVEHIYYMHLARVEKNLFKRYYFSNESAKLKAYQDILSKSNGIAAISKNDALHYEKRFNNVKVIRPFHPYNFINIKKGQGAYCLYHGNLEIGENIEAVTFLIRNVFSVLTTPLIIAGNKPSTELKELCKTNENISLIANPGSEEMNKLLRNAHIHILPTFQSTGIKLKLYAALYSGRHCIVNKTMVKDTGLEQLCHIAETTEDFIKYIKELMQTPFEQELIDLRKNILEKTKFSNRHNINQLTRMLFKDQ